MPLVAGLVFVAEGALDAAEVFVEGAFGAFLEALVDGGGDDDYGKFDILLIEGAL